MRGMGRVGKVAGKRTGELQGLNLFMTRIIKKLGFAGYLSTMMMKTTTIIKKTTTTTTTTT